MCLRPVIKMIFSDNVKRRVTNGSMGCPKRLLLLDKSCRSHTLAADQQTHTRSLGGKDIFKAIVCVLVLCKSPAFEPNDKWVKNLRLMTQICLFLPINFMHK